MTTLRKLPLSEISHEHFAAEDVMTTDAERFERKHMLTSAMAQTNADHEEVHLTVKLASGELVEITTNLLDLGDSFVEVRGGKSIPLRAIVSVDL